MKGLRKRLIRNDEQKRLEWRDDKRAREEEDAMRHSEALKKKEDELDDLRLERETASRYVTSISCPFSDLSQETGNSCVLQTNLRAT